MNVLVATPQIHVLDYHAHVRIPVWVTDLDSFRRWARSDDFPQRGRFAFIDGELWVDLSMEKLIHNQIKGGMNTDLATLVRQGDRGFYYPDGMLVTNV